MEAYLKFRKLYFFIGFVALIITSLVSVRYRDWVYGNNIFDFGLADYAPSIGGTITVIFLSVGLFQKSSDQILKSAIAAWAGCAIYEVLQPYLGSGVFDIKDFLAVIITGAITCLILRKNTPNEVTAT